MFVSKVPAFHTPGAHAHRLQTPLADKVILDIEQAQGIELPAPARLENDDLFTAGVDQRFEHPAPTSTRPENPLFENPSYPPPPPGSQDRASPGMCAPAIH